VSAIQLFRPWSEGAPVPMYFFRGTRALIWATRQNDKLVPSFPQKLRQQFSQETSSARQNYPFITHALAVLFRFNLINPFNSFNITSRHFIKRARSVPPLALADGAFQRAHSSQRDLFEAGCKICADEFRFFKPTKFHQEGTFVDRRIHTGLQPYGMPRAKNPS